MVTRSGALPRLQRRFLAPLSNGNIGLMLDLAKHGRLPWDANFGAEIAQAYKPSPDAYLRNAEARRLKPERICFIAAHNYDLAARGCGFRTGAGSTDRTRQLTLSLPAENWDGCE
jgi:2-haloacid dehalogenase